MNGVKRYTLTAKGERLRDYIEDIQDELEGLFTRTSAFHSLPTSQVPAAVKELNKADTSEWRRS